MPARKPITNFSRGEFGPELYGRVDIPQYEAGAKKLKNFIVQRYGGAAFRPGFRYVSAIPDVARISLIPFQYSIEASYVLVMSELTMSLAANGGMVVEEDLKIVSVSYGATTTLEIPFHDYAIGDRINLSGNTGPLGLNGRSVKVLSVPGANHVEVELNSIGFEALTASTGTVRVATPVAPPAPEAPLPAPPPPPEAPVTDVNTYEPPTYFDGSEGGTYDDYVGGGGYWSKLSGSL